MTTINDRYLAFARLGRIATGANADLPFGVAKIWAEHESDIDMQLDSFADLKLWATALDCEIHIPYEECEFPRILHTTPGDNVTLEVWCLATPEELADVPLREDGDRKAAFDWLAKP